MIRKPEPAATVTDSRPMILHTDTARRYRYGRKDWGDIPEPHYETPEERQRYQSRSRIFELVILGILIGVGIFVVASLHGCHNVTAPDPHYLRVNITSYTHPDGTTFYWDDPIEILVEDDGRALPDSISTGGRAVKEETP